MENTGRRIEYPLKTKLKHKTQPLNRSVNDMLNCIGLQNESLPDSNGNEKALADKHVDLSTMA